MLFKGFVCKGTDPCTDETDECPASSTCVANAASKGGYDCVCPAGLELDEEGECVDIDECLSSPCGDMEVCQNTVGGFQCKCQQGTTLNDSSICVDIDECAEIPCATNGICNNIEFGGGYSCSCPRGYLGDGYKVNDSTCKAFLTCLGMRRTPAILRSPETGRYSTRWCHSFGMSSPIRGQ